MKSLIEKLANYSSENANGFAIISSSKIITYAVLNSLVNILSYQLYNDGIREGNRIAVISNNNPDFIMLILALWKIGAVPVPINTKLASEEINAIAEFCKPDLIFIHKNLNLNLSGNKSVKSFPVEINYGTSHFESGILNPENSAVIIFTSGSAGSPKGVVHTFNSLLNSCRMSAPLLELQPGDKWLLSLPMYHIGGFSILARVLFSGAGIIIPDSNSTNDLIYCINNLRCTHISLVPTQLKRIIETGTIPNNELKKTLIGGGPADVDLISDAECKGWKINKVYGSTETFAFITMLEPDDFKTKHRSAGKPLAGVDIKISNGNNKTESGEILVSSPSLMKEYLFNNEETSQKLIEGYYHSGDIGYLDKEGFLYIETRRMDLIISGGENINPIEVENQILKMASVNDVCVFGITDEEWGQICAAAIVTDENKTITFEEIKDFLSEKVASYKIPKRIFIEEELPKTTLGKIKRQEIAKKYNAENQNDSPIPN